MLWATAFQFQYGAIGSLGQYLVFAGLHYFNSSMVRLGDVGFTTMQNAF